MTDNQLSTSGNPHCDGNQCTSAQSRVRIIKVDDSTNAHLCESCYRHEVLEGGLPFIAFDVFPSLLPNQASHYHTPPRTSYHYRTIQLSPPGKQGASA